MNHTNPTSSPAPRRGRFRFLYQYSLRTLLVVTAVVALFCNWYFQPKRHDELLAGGRLKIHKQMKVLTPEEYDELRRPNGWGGKATEPTPIEHGIWELLDEHELTLVRGDYRSGEPAGRWRAWYPSGQKSAEGNMRDGAPVGLWRTWHENRQLRSEVTLAEWAEIRKRLVHVVTESFGGIHATEAAESMRPASILHGPARAWHANGKLKFDGQYALGLPQGAWTYCDEHGDIAAQGLYVAGQRHGTWTFTAAGASREMLYFHGYRQDEVKEYYAHLTAGLLSSQRYRRLEAANGLTELGPAAVPLLVKIMNSDDPAWLAHGGGVPAADAGDGTRNVPATYSAPSAMQCAVQMVWKLGPVAKDALPMLERLADNDDAPLAEQARVAIFVVDESVRPAQHGQLIAAISQWPDHDAALESLVQIYRHDVPRRKETFQAAVGMIAGWPKVEQQRAADRLATLPGNVLDYLDDTALSDDIRFRLLISLITKTVVPQSWSFPPQRQKQLDGLIDRLRDDNDPEVSTMGRELYKLRQPLSGGSGPGGGGGGGFF